MKGKMTNKWRCTIFSLLGICVACSTNDIPEAEDAIEGEHICKLILDAPKPSYDDADTRTGAADWSDGDCVYFVFTGGNENVDGRAVYSLQDNDWTLYYNGQLPTAAASKCRAYYFGGECTDKGNALELTVLNSVYLDNEGTYQKTADAVKVNAHMRPATGRIRFEGEPGLGFNVAGACSYNTFDRKEGLDSNTPVTLAAAIGPDGGTPYYYLYFGSDERRELAISYGDFTFSRTCDSPILDPGQSGYIVLPTKEAHNGWNMRELTSPSLSAVTVSGLTSSAASFSATVTSNGNGTLSDAGFVYSTSPTPSLDSNRYSCGTSTTLSASVANLSPVTTYYVWAYAINEKGTSYSEAKQFTTPYGEVEITTGQAGDITLNTAKVACTIGALGGHTITERGLCWSKQPEPTVDDNCLRASTEDNKYEITLTGLDENETYYVRAYAKTAEGTTYYGKEVSFKTKARDVNIDKDDYGEDSNWTSDNSNANVGKDDYDEDSNWNGASDNANVGKEDYGEDGNWNNAPDYANVGKKDYGEDNDWNSNK